MRYQQRRWRLRLRSGRTLADLAETINAVIRGWMHYCVPRGRVRSVREEVRLVA
jgi:hypothetical protein